MHYSGVRYNYPLALNPQIRQKNVALLSGINFNTNRRNLQMQRGTV
jgi:hypothetical protein